MRTRISIIAAAALSALALTVAATAGAATDVHIASLNGSAAFPAANGKVKYSVDDGVRQVEGQLENANALAGKRVRLEIRGTLVDTALVSQLGKARFVASGPTIPRVATGSVTRVETTAGALVASGRFG